MRIAPLTPDQLSDAQRAVHEHIGGGPRGGVRGPFLPLLHSPELARRIADVGEFLRFQCSLAPKLRELAILVVARDWGAQYEWYAHAPIAARHGLSAEVIEALRTRTAPPFADDQERLVHDFTLELVETRNVGDANYRAAVAAFGLTGTVELVGLAYHYMGIAAVLNVFGMTPPPDTTLPLPPAR
jgi:4-carboxymuconolactone decarboxylase